ncbi:MAG: hypothetical protein AAFU49_18045, partial [Pseudomonadota bacterium]
FALAFNALNRLPSMAKTFTRDKLRRKLGEIDAAIERYLGELDRADRPSEETGGSLPRRRDPHG